MIPQNAPPASNGVFPAQDARLLRYQDVLAKMTMQRQPTTNLSSAESTPNLSDGWISEEEDEAKESKGQLAIKSKAVGQPLLGGFADAETVD
jgi:hypothetical protein